MERPDLSNTDPLVRDYIEYLERRLRIGPDRHRDTPETDELPVSDAPLPAEAPTTLQIITISKEGYTKRTARHHYPRQHRGGMGIFDLDLNGDDYPVTLANTDEEQSLLVFTNKARVYRHPVSKISSTDVHAKGKPLFDRSPLDHDEWVTVALPVRATGYVAMLSANGRVRILRHHLFGEHLKPGTSLFKYDEFGPLVSACWTAGDGDLFIASRSGQAIRFNEKLVSPQGDWGIRLSGDDSAVSITSIYPDSTVILIGKNGKGTRRAMSGFAPNKSAGGSGKQAMKTPGLVGSVACQPDDEVFLISQLGKIIRFRTDEIPLAEGTVQGVNCMSLRGDEVSSVLISSQNHSTNGLF